MIKKRIIARLDIKNNYVIKGINLEGLRKVGEPINLAKSYYDQGIDEIVFMDAVASLYDRNNLLNIIELACKDVFIPITIGGGIRSINDIDFALKAGADKITINTQAIKNPNFIKDASRIYGSQCIVGSIEAKKRGNSWEAYINYGREQTGVDVVDWACKLEDLGIGELLITSVDKEGTKKGFELDLIDQICNKLNIPVIVSGGAGNLKQITELLKLDRVSGVALASILHYNISDVNEIKRTLNTEGILVRK
jgi:cyclase